MEKRASQFCATEGHLEDVCHREKWLLRLLYRMKAEKESQWGERAAVTSHSVIDEYTYVLLLKHLNVSHKTMNKQGEIQTNSMRLVLCNTVAIRYK